jgi:hypothetical protein
MANYFLHVKTFARGQGSKVTKAAAYRTGERIRDGVSHIHPTAVVVDRAAVGVCVNANLKLTHPGDNRQSKSDPPLGTCGITQMPFSSPFDRLCVCPSADSSPP